MITLPVSVEPVNEILSTPGCATSAAPVVSPRPCSRLMTPGSSPGRSSHRCRNSAVEAGVSSDDLTTTVQPAASAAPSLRTVRSTGSFHGMISAATPSGSGIVRSSRCAGEAPVTSPCSTRAAPAKNRSLSTAPTSSRTRESRIGLPISREISCASGSMFASSRSASSSSTAARSAARCAFQAGSAARAAWTARSTSSASASGECASIEPSSQAITSNTGGPATHSPPIRWRTSIMRGPPRWCRWRRPARPRR